MSGKKYTPIRYTDPEGEIKDIDVLLVCSGKIYEYDVENDTDYYSKIFYAMPSGKLSDGTTDLDFYNIFENDENTIKLSYKDFLKDRYETLSINYEIQYKGVNGIELSNYVTKEGYNLLLSNKVEKDSCIVLYDKSKYRYIYKNSILGDYSSLIKPYDDETYESNNLFTITGNKVEINLLSQVDLDNYNPVIYKYDRQHSEIKEMIMALNNLSGTSDKITIYLNGKKYSPTL